MVPAVYTSLRDCFNVNHFTVTKMVLRVEAAACAVESADNTNNVGQNGFCSVVSMKYRKQRSVLFGSAKQTC